MNRYRAQQLGSQLCSLFLYIPFEAYKRFLVSTDWEEHCCHQHRLWALIGWLILLTCKTLNTPHWTLHGNKAAPCPMLCLHGSATRLDSKWVRTFFFQILWCCHTGNHPWDLDLFGCRRAIHVKKLLQSFYILATWLNNV